MYVVLIRQAGFYVDSMIHTPEGSTDVGVAVKVGSQAQAIVAARTTSVKLSMRQEGQLHARRSVDILLSCPVQAVRMQKLQGVAGGARRNFGKGQRRLIPFWERLRMQRFKVP